jgi:hypothetical protein
MHMLEWIGCTIMQWKKYRAIMWQLKLHGTERGWQGVSEPSVLNSKSKVRAFFMLESIKQ